MPSYPCGVLACSGRSGAHPTADVSVSGSQSPATRQFTRRPCLPLAPCKPCLTLSSLNGSLCSGTRAGCLERQADAMNKCLP